MKEKLNKANLLFKNSKNIICTIIILIIIIIVALIFFIKATLNKSTKISNEEVTKIVSEKYLETNSLSKVDYNIKYFDKVSNVYIVEVLNSDSGKKIIEYGVNATTKEAKEVSSKTDEMN